MIPSPVHPFFSGIIAILILCGTLLIGQIIIFRIYKKNKAVLSLSVGMIFVSQFLYITSMNQITFYLFYPVGLLLILGGLYYIYKYKNNLVFKCSSKDLSYIIISLLALGFLLASMGPPTMADALDYHLGIPAYLLRHKVWPPTSLWIHGSLGGIGEIYNTLGLAMYSDNVGAVLQAISLILLCNYLSVNVNNDQAYFIKLFILTSPVLMFLVTGPKPQLFPQVLTALALHITVSSKKIDSKKYLLICFLLMGAAQQKLSFLMTGGVVGLWATYKGFKESHNIIFSAFFLFIIFFMPRGLWNLQQLSDFNLIGFFTPVPQLFLRAIHMARENPWWFPFNLFFPYSFGTITTMLGFQLFIILNIKTKNGKFWEAMFLIITGSALTYFFGLSNSRTFYEFVLWTAVAFSFLSHCEFNFNFFNRLLMIQGTVVIAIVSYGVYNLTSGLISSNFREEIMHKTAYQFSAVNWLNKILPEDAVVLSQLRSVSLFRRNFVPMDWFKIGGLNRTIYYQQIKNMNVNYIALNGKLSEDFPLYGCVGKMFTPTKQFYKATRNPFNAGQEYNVSVYYFNSKLLPGCAI